MVRRAPGPFPALGLRLTALTERLLTLDGELNEHLADPDEVLAHDEALIAELDAVEADEGKLTAAPRRRVPLPVPAPSSSRWSQSSAGRRCGANGSTSVTRWRSAARLAEQVAEVASGERQKYATVLLDEYQDTSMAQQRLLVALFGSGHPVMAVGDPFQAIYGWRGASVRNILTLRPRLR